MEPINIIDLIKIKKAILKNVDEEIISHGIETAYIACMIAEELKYDKEKMYYLSICSFLHDIGAYKTEELENIKQFEFVDIGKHSVYGYVLLNQNKNMKKIAPAVLYHHHSYKDKNNYIEEIEIPEEAFLIGLSDKISTVCNLLKYDKGKIYKFIYNMNTEVFNPDHVKILYDLVENKKLIENIISSNYENYLFDKMKDVSIDIEQLKEYLIFLPISIDFFSFETALHTVCVSEITKKICEKLKICEKEKDKIELGAYLHDLGKVCTPKNILEKEGKLTNEEFEIMKKHVIYSREILEEARINEELISLACNHHEKLDGSGYPRGLNKNDLTLGDRIICVSDIFCALTEKRHYKEAFSKCEVLKILHEMVDLNHIDKNVVKIIELNYDEFINFVNENRQKYEYRLNYLLRKYNRISDKMDKLGIY